MVIRYKYDDNVLLYYNSDSFKIKDYENIVNLECFNNNLKRLPILPNSLKELRCSYNKLIELPILPNSLKTLDCSGNFILKLPILSNNLVNLYCGNNKLNNLPILPINLYHLCISVNLLTKLPKINKHINSIIFDRYKIKYIYQYNIDLIRIKIYYYIKF